MMKLQILKNFRIKAGKSIYKEEMKKSLRYGKLLFMTDQDLDGSHIKGLCINMFSFTMERFSKNSKFSGIYEYSNFKSN